VDQDLKRHRAGVVDDDAIRKRVAVGSARPDALVQQSSREGTPNLLDMEPPASR
jgi:hypothetical protein